MGYGIVIADVARWFSYRFRCGPTEMTIAQFILGCFTALGLGVLFGLSWSHSLWEKYSVTTGHAEWYIEKHKKHWRWKELDNGTD